MIFREREAAVLDVLQSSGRGKGLKKSPFRYLVIMIGIPIGKKSD